MRSAAFREAAPRMRGMKARECPSQFSPLLPGATGGGGHCQELINSLLISCILHIALLIAACAFSAVKIILVFNALVVINDLLHLMQ